jgi:hydrogenase maturation factor
LSQHAANDRFVAGLRGGVGTHVLRDPTRGGLASVLCEIPLASQGGIRIAGRRRPPTSPPVARGAKDGRVVAEGPGRVLLHTRVGSRRLLERLSVEQLPRIC